MQPHGTSGAMRREGPFSHRRMYALTGQPAVILTWRNRYRATLPRMPAAMRPGPAAASAPAAVSAAAVGRRHLVPDALRSAAAAAGPAGSRRERWCPATHWRRAAQPAGAARRLSASVETGADRGRAAPSRKKAGSAELRPARRQGTGRPPVESTPALPRTSVLHAQSNPACGSRDRSPSPPATTTAP